jgi:hypothetical protein
MFFLMVKLVFPSGDPLLLTSACDGGAGANGLGFFG